MGKRLPTSIIQSLMGQDKRVWSKLRSIGLNCKVDRRRQKFTFITPSRRFNFFVLRIFVFRKVVWHSKNEVVRQFTA